MKVKNKKNGHVCKVLIFNDANIVIVVKDKNGINKKMWLDVNQFSKYWEIIE
jgi:hypothetical protein